MNNTKSVNFRLKQAREQRGYTIQALVDRIDQDPNRPELKKSFKYDRYKGWEYGQNAIPIEWIPTLCRNLECDSGYLFGEYDELTRELSDIYTATRLTETAVKNIRKLDRFGNRHFEVRIYGKLSMRELLSSIIEDDRLTELLYSLQKAKVCEYNLNNCDHDSEITGGQYMQAEQVINQVGMISLERADAVKFYLQDAVKAFGTIIEDISVNCSRKEAYRSTLIDFDAKTIIEKDEDITRGELYYPGEIPDET